MENELNKNDQNTEGFNFTDILYQYISYWPLFVTLLAGGIVLACLFTLFVTPKYEIKATVLIKDNRKAVNETNANIVESLDLFSTKKNVENEIEAMDARVLINEVVLNLSLYAPILSDQPLKNKSAYLSSPFRIQVKHPENLNEIDKLYFEAGTNDSVKLQGKSFALNQWLAYQGDTLKFIKNPAYKAPLVQSPLYFFIENPKKTVTDLMNKLDIVSSNKQATVIDITYRDAIPERGEAILNELIRVYNKAAITDKNLLAGNTLSFVEIRLKNVVHELDSIEAAIEVFKTKKGIVDISEQGKNYLESVEANDKQTGEINMKLAEIDDVESYVKSKENNTGTVPSTRGLDDLLLTPLLQKLYDLEIDYERLRKTTAPQNPLLISIQDQINKVKPSILENIKSQRSSLLAGKNNLTITTARYTSSLKDIPQNERGLLEISRQQVIKNNIYTFLLQKREETALSFASGLADSRVLDPPTASYEPVFPKKIVVFPAAILVSIFFSIGYVFLKEVLNRKVKNRADVEKFLSWPILGEISYSPTKDAIVADVDERNIVAEQIRHLRTSLSYLGINKNNKKILITSAIAGEGKTFVAVNLAMSIALSNKKVVLVELDLRKPTLSSILKIKREIGITNYLMGECNISDIIKGTANNKNLYFISCGPIPPNPSELMLDKRMEELLQHLDNTFDYVIINTAPIVPVTDACILSKLCDSTLFIVRQGFTPNADLKKVEENNIIRGLKNVGIVFNCLADVKYKKYGNEYELQGDNKPWPHTNHLSKN